MQLDKIELKTSKEIVIENRRNQMALAAAAIVGTSGVDVRAYQATQKAEAERLKRQASMQVALRKMAAEKQQQQVVEEAAANTVDDGASDTASVRSGTTATESTSDFFNDGADSETGSVGGEVVVVESGTRRRTATQQRPLIIFLLNITLIHFCLLLLSRGRKHGGTGRSKLQVVQKGLQAAPSLRRLLALPESARRGRHRPALRPQHYARRHSERDQHGNTVLWHAG